MNRKTTGCDALAVSKGDHQPYIDITIMTTNVNLPSQIKWGEEDLNRVV